MNTISLSIVKAHMCDLPSGVRWIPTDSLVPNWFASHLDWDMAEGVAWKFAPVRVFPGLHELSLDNDVILWGMPEAMKEWLQCGDTSACLMAADRQSALGQFSAMCQHRALNSGIRGLLPGFDLESRLRSLLEHSGITLRSELDEQGLQAAVLLQSKLFAVSTDDVSICSPFPNHQQHLGKCGAHFVGLNPKQVPWMLEGRGAHEVIRERWNTYSSELAQLVQLPACLAAE